MTAKLVNYFFILILLTALIIIGQVTRRALGETLYPPLGYIANELGVAKGVQLQKGVIWNGRPFFFYIVSAQEHPNGRYTVEIQAR